MKAGQIGQHMGQVGINAAGHGFTGSLLRNNLMNEGVNAAQIGIKASQVGITAGNIGQ